ncbi:helix-turn-helix domain-containing protein [Streptomyces inhibens]|uniref:helix-turn-helix domain-containing protein n=1 Tax=Streptomyces inhibens TaxID=2293571 RepID=UPI001EE75A22|nr:helix-turn-helix domain-containing protein [Streptomyces inhibens]UKY48931.1 helix-turn-helix domain-containing protein [Streptomyces inhibens]
MTTTWGTSAIPLGDRADALRQTIREQVVPVELVLPRCPERVFADVVIAQIGSMQLSTVNANPATVLRTPRLAKTDWEPVLFISLQVSGESAVVQDGRHAVLCPGDIAFYDTRRPYTLLFDRGVDMHFFRIPISEIALPDAAIHEVTARTLGADGSISGLTSGYLSRLAASPQLHEGTASPLLAAPSMELVRAVIASEAEKPALGTGSFHETLGLRILEYMRTHLADRDLTPASVAQAHHISVRYLYAILARSDISFGEWVRTHRLDECRRELSRRPPSADTVSAIAHRWGFKSSSHFSRAFKSAFGVSPQAWRDALR